MKVIKVIDLLNRIANGEIPEKIKFIGKIWEYDDSVNDYSYFLIDHYEYFFNNISFSYINDEVEIIEDTPKVQVEMTEKEYWKYLDSKLDTPKKDKKIEKLNWTMIDGNCIIGMMQDPDEKLRVICQKFDEIIEVINERNI